MKLVEVQQVPIFPREAGWVVERMLDSGWQNDIGQTGSGVTVGEHGGDMDVLFGPPVSVAVWLREIVNNKDEINAEGN